jgi:hypothetical protein
MTVGDQSARPPVAGAQGLAASPAMIVGTSYRDGGGGFARRGDPGFEI